uniref:Transmembrane protein 70 homolog, mitochondrial n=1 Tax=Panagrellus redivivus TaxID=6233 RepID=A0A7E4VL58_PANRE
MLSRLPNIGCRYALANRHLLSGFSALRCSSSATTSTPSFQRVPLASISKDDLGVSIMHLKENGGEASPTDLLRKGVLIAKLCSIGSSSLGVVMIPVLTSYMWQAASERPSMMVFAILANGFLGLLTFTPLLLHFLAKRFVANVFYNADSKVFTTVHFNFFLQKRALRFKASDVVDSAIAPETKKLWLPLATCFVGGQPLLLSLDRRQYRNEAAFDILTKNINIPENAD